MDTRSAIVLRMTSREGASRAVIGFSVFGSARCTTTSVPPYRPASALVLRNSSSNGPAWLAAQVQTSIAAPAQKLFLRFTLYTSFSHSPYYFHWLVLTRASSSCKKHQEVSITIKAGRAIHHADVRTDTCRNGANRFPQLGAGSPTPRPTKDRVTSAKIYCGISKATCVARTL